MAPPAVESELAVGGVGAATLPEPAVAEPPAEPAAELEAPEPIAAEARPATRETADSAASPGWRGRKSVQARRPT